MKGRTVTTGPAFAPPVVQGSQEAVAAPELSLWAPREQGQCLLCFIHCPLPCLAQCLPQPPYQGLSLDCFHSSPPLLPPEWSRHTWKHIDCQVTASPPRVHVCVPWVQSGGGGVGWGACSQAGSCSACMVAKQRSPSPFQGPRD